MLLFQILAEIWVFGCSPDPRDAVVNPINQIEENEGEREYNSRNLHEWQEKEI